MCYPHDFFKRKIVLPKKGDEISPFDGTILCTSLRTSNSATNNMMTYMLVDDQAGRVIIIYEPTRITVINIHR
jgi:hypothetical protein